MGNNPLIDRYYSPLGLDADYDPREIADATKRAIENVKTKLAKASDESERRELESTLRKLTRSPR
jgi:hypothetical protein